MDAEQSQRGAALAGRAEGALHDGIDHLFRQGGGIDQHRVDPAGFGDQRHDRPVLGGQRAIDDPRHLGRAGEHDAGNPRLRHQRRADGVPRPVQQLQRIRGNAASVQQLHGLQGDGGRLLGRLGQHAVASRQRRGHLAGKNRQWKIPGADAGPSATAGEPQFVGLPRHSQRDPVLPARQHGRRHDPFRFAGVIAQEVDCLAHFRHRVAPGLERFLDQQRAQARQLMFHGVGGATQDGRTLADWNAIPAAGRRDRAVHRAADVSHGEQGDRRDLQRVIRGKERLPHRCHGQVQPGAVAAPRSIQIRWQRQRLHRFQPQRRHQQRVHADRFVGELVHERRVRAILQQSPHQISQQVAVLTDRRIDAATERRVLQHLAVNSFAHAVQALQFKGRCRPGAGSRAVGRHLQDRGDGAGIVGGELRKDRVAGLEQGPGTGQIRDVGVVLVGEHGIVRQAQLLRALDLGVPVSAFDQPAHEAQSQSSPQGSDVGDQLQRAGLVGLQRQPEALPLRMLAGDPLRQGFEHLQRQLEPVRFLGIDGEADVGAGRQLAQVPCARHQLGQDAVALAIFVARMQRAQLDRDAVVASRIAAGLRCLRNRRDRTAVAFEVLHRVGFGAGAFAQHVVGEAQVGLMAAGSAGGLQRLRHVLAQHELAAQQLHGAQRCGDHGLCTEPGQQPLLRGSFSRTIGWKKALGHRDRRLRQPRQRRIRRTIEIRAAELVGGERDRRFGVRHPQQRLRQAHQGEAFRAGDRVFLEQAFHGPERRGVLAHSLDPRLCGGGRGGPVQCFAEHGQQVCHHAGFRPVRKRKLLGHPLIVVASTVDFQLNCVKERMKHSRRREIAPIRTARTGDRR